MSAETRAALEAALANHAADECSAVFIDSYVIYVCYLDSDDLETRAHGYMPIYPETQAFHTSAGLARMLDVEFAHSTTKPAT